MCREGGKEEGIYLERGYADTDCISCGDVCRHVRESQSEIGSRDIFAEIKVFMIVAALGLSRTARDIGNSFKATTQRKGQRNPSRCEAEGRH